MDQQCPGAVLFCKRPSALGPEEASAPSAPSSNTSDRLLHVEALYRTNAIPSFARFIRRPPRQMQALPTSPGSRSRPTTG